MAALRQTWLIFTKGKKINQAGMGIIFTRKFKTGKLKTKHTLEKKLMAVANHSCIVAKSMDTPMPGD